MDEDKIEGTAQRFAGKAQGAVGGMMGDSKIKAEGMAREAGGNVQEAVGTAKDAVSNASENFGEVLKKIQAQLTELGGQLKEGAGSAGGVLTDRSKQAVTAMGEQVQESPVTSLLVIGAVGYLLGFLSRRS